MNQPGGRRTRGWVAALPIRTRTVFLVMLAALLVLFVVYAALLVRHGFGARDEPSALEALIARKMRSLAMPAGARARANPYQPTAEVLAEARGHFADHCAICHANNGSGDTAIGKRLYPRAPDMRLPATQERTDGELYYIIHNGIRLSGMPAWGGDELDDGDSWKLALFIHRLPRLSPAEEQAMSAMNPRSAAEWKRLKAEEEFLRGGEPAPADAERKQEHP